MAKTDTDVTKMTKKQEAEYYEELVPMFIPITDDNEVDEITVGHNGTIYKIQKGKEVMIPRKLSIILQNSNAQAVAMKQYSESVKDQELNA